MTSFPDDMTQLILFRLPIKSLLKFRAVSKSWKTIISDPIFIRTHLRRSKLLPTNSNLFLQKQREYDPLLLGADSPYLLVRAEDDDVDGFRFRFEANLGSPLGDRPWPCEALHCTCDGLVLLSHVCSGSYTLWNPSTREEARLPPQRSLLTNHVMRGICYDPITLRDFKVVLVSVDSTYDVFSCDTGTWSEKGKIPFRMRGADQLVRDGKCVDGVVYWVAVALEDRKSVREILYYDRRMDHIKTLPKPQGVTRDDTINLVCLGGCLCVYRQAVDHVRFWIKDDDNNTSSTGTDGDGHVSWKELMVIENLKTLKELMVVENLKHLRSLLMKMDRFEPMCFVGDDHNIVIKVGWRRFVVYNPRQKSFSQCENPYKTCYWNQYLPTLLFPHTHNG